MGEVNPWLADKLAKLNSPPTISLLVEITDPSQEQETMRRLQGIPDVQVGETSLGFIHVVAPPKTVNQIAAIPGVLVHYDAPVTIRGLALDDPLMGRVRLSSVEIPYSPQQMMARNAHSLAGFPLRLFGKGPTPKVIITPTGETRKRHGLPEDARLARTKVAVLDTGLTPTHPVFINKGMIKLGTFAGPVPFDGLGHGEHVSSTAFGGSWQTRFGLCRGVADAQNGTLGSWKVLSDVGFGSNWGIIQGIDAAVKWGARVINMSLGGELQGDVDTDPLCRIMTQLKDRVIFVVAAGNEGPKHWTIGTPGASPDVVTVGAWSTIYDGLAIFSSRGPSGKWYESRPDVWALDYSKYGEDLIKPDLVAPGGGPVKESQKIDTIYSAVTGWTDGMNDGVPFDLGGGMRGTSMATPHAAGVIALAVEHGLVKTARDVKNKMALFAPKDELQGYGFITWKKISG